MRAPSAECMECRNLLGGYVLDAIEPDEQAAVQDHLERCEECGSEFAALAGIPVLLDNAGEAFRSPAAPPASLEEAVLDSFAREHNPGRGRRAPVPARAGRLARAFSRPLPAALAGALAAAAVAVGIVVANGGGSGRPEALEAHLTGAAGATANAELATFRSGTSVELRVSGLRGAPGVLYELWCVRNDGGRVSAGTFRVGPAGDADVALTTGALPSEYHVLTIERLAAGSGTYTGTQVMRGSIQYPPTSPYHRL